MKLREVEVVTPEGKTIKVMAEVWGRKGWMAPATYVLLYNDRRITPYEQRLKGWSFSLNGLFKLVYSDKLSDLIAGENVFLKMIRKDRAEGSLYHRPVVLGLEHGVTFAPKKTWWDKLRDKWYEEV